MMKFIFVVKIQTTYYSRIHTAESLNTLHLLRAALHGEFTNSKHQAEDAEHMNERMHTQHARHHRTAKR